MPETTERLEIRTSQWLRGELCWRETDTGDRNNESALLDPETGRCCCLGLDALRVFPVDLLRPDEEGAAYAPDALWQRCRDRALTLTAEQERYFARWVEVYDNGIQCTDLACTAMTDNDNDELSEEERRERIGRHFAAAGIEVVFVDDEPKEEPHADA